MNNSSITRIVFTAKLRDKTKTPESNPYGFRKAYN
jgi:hypothetical protein